MLRRSAEALSAHLPRPKRSSIEPGLIARSAADHQAQIISTHLSGDQPCVFSEWHEAAQALATLRPLEFQASSNGQQKLF